MDFGLEFVTGSCNSGDLLFFYDSRATLIQFLVNVSYHVRNFTLKKLLWPQVLLVNLVNHFQTISFLLICSWVELNYEGKQLFLCVLYPFAIDVAQIIQLNDLNGRLFFRVQFAFNVALYLYWFKFWHPNSWTLLWWFFLIFYWFVLQ